MRIDQRDHGLVRQMLVDEIERGLRRLDRAQRVHDDPPRVPLEEGDVGDVEPAYLVHAVGDLEETAVHVELSEPPETRVHRIRRRSVRGDERVGGQVPGERTSRTATGDSGRSRRDEATLRELEIL